MIVKISNIPKQYRSTHYKGVVPANSLPVNTSNSSSSSAGSYNPPYYIDANGDLVLSQKKFWFDDEYIDESKIITWDEAVALKHQHDNWEQIRTIDQDLSTASTPSFTGLNITNQANIWRANITGGLVMNNKTISEVNTIGFQPYEKDGVMFTNIITNQNSGGIRINCPIKVEGSFEFMGSNRDFYSYNYDMNIIHYTYDWRKGSRLTLTDTAVVTDNLNVTGTFNCFELVANKVRSTNGLLYVTDSATVKEMTGDKLVVIFTEYNLKVGDYLLMQTFTGNSIVKKLIKLTYQSPNDGNHFTYHVVGSNGELIRPQDANSAWLPAVNDYFVKIDSEDLSRRTGILLNPYNGGYIDFYTGAGDGINKTITTRLGNLDGMIFSRGQQMSGMGLYSDNAYIRGKIYATDLDFDGLIDGNKINAESMVVRNLKTSDTGVKIEASGHDLKMLDANNQIKLLVTGNKYNSINSFVNSSGAGGNYTITQKSLNGSCGSFVQGIPTTERNSAEMVPRFYVPATGSYKLIIPPINISMYGNADNAYGTMHINIYLKNGDGDVVKLIKQNSMFVNGNSLSSSVSSETMEVNLEGNRYYRIEVTSEFTANLSNEGIRGSVTINTTAKPVSQDYVVLQEHTNNTTIFENGLGYKASTTKYAVIINSDDSGDPVFQARNGNTVFKIAPNGVFVSDNAGGDWRKL